MESRAGLRVRRFLEDYDMTEEQFHALELWILAATKARAVEHSAGPHVSEALRVYGTRRDEAFGLLVTVPTE